MSKRLTLLVGTFGVLLLAFVVYYYASEGALPRPWSFDRPVKAGRGDDTRFPQVTIQDVPPSSFSQYDDQHRLQAVYMFNRMRKRGGRYYLDEPQVNWYLKSGERAVIKARRGVFRINQVGDTWDVRDGELTGDVRIVMDRRVRPGAEPLARRQADAVRIHTEELTFDRDRLMIESARQVAVFSKEADILGTGLRLSWSDSPQELRELRIVHGEYMCIREGQERFMDRMSLPGGAEESARSRPPEPAAWAGRPAGGWFPAVGRGLVTAAFAVTRPATGPAAAATRPGVTTRPARVRPSKEPVGAPGGPPPVVKDTYHIVFSDNVEVSSGQRRLRGGEKLTLVFEYEDPRRRERREADARRAQARSAETRPAGPGRPAATAASRPVASRPAAASRPRPAAAEKRPRARPATQPADPAKPLIITWTGPLVITPLRQPEEHIPDRFDVKATGRKLELVEGEAAALCGSFEFSSLGNSGELLGWEDRPVELRMASGERLSAPVVRFNREQEWVRLVGAGDMSMPASQSDILGAGTAAGEEPGEVTIRWKEQVVASIGEQEVRTATGTTRRSFLRQATFTEAVDVKQPPGKGMKASWLQVDFHEPKGLDDPINQIKLLQAAGGAEQVHLTDSETGEYIKADKLRVPMATSPGGKSYPLEAVATGNVSARQADQQIAAEEVTVKFAVGTDEITGKEKPEPRRLVATGKVKVIDTSEADPVEGLCEKLIADPVAKTAKLIGKPAVVTEKDNILKANDIFLSQATESAKVTGGGQLRFWSDTDLSGNKVDKARPVDIVWTKALDYHGRERLAVVTGDVELNTPEDQVRCGEMQVTFAAEKETATKPAEAEGRRFRQRKIAQVVAEKDVELFSVQKDAQGYLQRRLLLRSGKVIYEATVKAVRSPKPGMMLVEDYRPPKPADKKKKPAAGALGPQDVTRPSQSRFQWSKSMHLDQEKRVVRLAGDVHMDHRSGKQIVLLKELNVRPCKELPRGRSTSLDCEKMLATFAEPDLPAAGRPADRTAGPRLGKLMIFDAQGDVNFKDGRQQVVCQRILYQREQDVAIIWGYLTGQKPKDAVFYHEDKAKAALNRIKSPKMTWDRKTNRVVTAGGVEAHGG